MGDPSRATAPGPASSSPPLLRVGAHPLRALPATGIPTSSLPRPPPRPRRGGDHGEWQRTVTEGSRSPFDTSASDQHPPPRDPFKPAPFQQGSRQAPNYGSVAEDEKLLSRASCFLSLSFFFLLPFQGSFSLPSHEVKELKTNSETDNRVTVPHKKAAEALEKAGIRRIRDFCRGSWE